jgi:hypothetical protein
MKKLVAGALLAMSIASCGGATIVPMKTIPNGGSCKTTSAGKNFSGSVCESGLCEQKVCVPACAGPTGSGDAVNGCDGPWS